MRSPAALKAVLATSAVLALVGCAATAQPGAGPAPDSSITQLSPTGDPGVWFSDAYAEGVDRIYATSNQVCAVADGLIVEQQNGPNFTHKVIAKEFARGAALWQIDNATCSDSGAFEGAVTVARNHDRDRDWQLIDIATGETRAKLPVDPRSVSVSPVTRADSTLVLEVDFDTFVGVDDGEVVWTAAQTGHTEIVPLSDGHIGVTFGLDDRASIVDGRTGETVAQLDIPQPGLLVWASDGFSVRVNQSDPEYAFYDLQGVEVDRTVGSSQYGFTPSPHADVTFTVADHIAAGAVVGVDAAGRPALYEGPNRRNFTPAGEIKELPDSIIMLRGVSADGSLLLFSGRADTESGTRDRIIVIDATGDEVFDWPALDGATSRIEAGYIVIEASGTTQVLLPPA